MSFVYSASRISGIFSGFLISFALAHGGVSAALMLIVGCMAVVVFSIGLLGPNTKGRSLEALALDDSATEALALPRTFSPMPHWQDANPGSGVEPTMKAAAMLRLDNQT